MSLEKAFANAKEVDLFDALPEDQKAEADLLADIAMFVHRKRIEMNMTQEQFAKFNNVSQAMVSKWESGEYNFSLQSLIKLFHSLGLEISIAPKESVERTDVLTEKIMDKRSNTAWDCAATGGKGWIKRSVLSPKYVAVI